LMYTAVVESCPKQNFASKVIDMSSTILIILDLNHMIFCKGYC
jgi:hypothetical protein